MEWCQCVERTETKLPSFGEFQVARDKNGMNILQIDDAMIVDEFQVHPLAIIWDFPGKHDVLATSCMPARLEDGVRKNHMGRAMVVDSDVLTGNVLNLGDVKGAGGAIADGNKFSFDERLAVRRIISSGISVGFRERGTVGQYVGRDTLVSPLSCIIDDRISCVAESFDDGAWSSPSRDMLGTASRLLHLLCCGRNLDFDLLANKKRLTTAMFV